MFTYYSGGHRRNAGYRPEKESAEIAENVPLTNGGIVKRFVLPAAAAVLAGAVSLGSVQAAPLDVAPVDCAAPAPDAEPGTEAWEQRERANVFCANQRHADKLAHPAGSVAVDPRPEKLAAGEVFQGGGQNMSRDTYRQPARHDGVRFRFTELRVPNRFGLPVTAEVYAPLEPAVGAYPLVVVVPGGAQGTAPGAPKETLRWVAQGLAEAGYVTSLHDITSEHYTDAKDVLTWALTSDDNPYRAEIDPTRVGIAGHSGGGATASKLGFEDPRIDAIVSFDRSSRYALPEDDALLTTPALFFVGDYGIGVTPHDSEPDPDGTGNKVDSFLRLRQQGTDTMHVALRATSHVDWGPQTAAGHRYTEVVSLYFTRAWFDRYLYGAADGFARLTAATFDSSGDELNISQGMWDPERAAASGDPYGGNVPYAISGTPVRDRLSFYFRSRCFISDPDGSGRVMSDDVRAHGCGR